LEEATSVARPDFLVRNKEMGTAFDSSHYRLMLNYTLSKVRPKSWKASTMEPEDSPVAEADVRSHGGFYK
jgi:hypothetical protein